MITEITAAVQSVKVLNDLLKAARELKNFNEFVAAVSEVNAKLMDAQSAALLSQEKQSSLAKRVAELEEEIMRLKAWDAEAKRYQLADIAPGVFAHCLKPGMEQGEPPHMLCTNCFAKREKSILQNSGGDTYQCPRCKNAIFVRIPE